MYSYNYYTIRKVSDYMDKKYCLEYVKKRSYLFLFLLGLVAGTVIINILNRGYYDKINITQEHYIKTISDVIVNKRGMFVYLVSKYFKEFAIIIICNCFFFGKIYNIFYIFTKGVSISIVLSSYVLKYGVKGLLVFIVSIFPHYFVYILVIVLAICAGFSMRNNVLHNTNTAGSLTNIDNVAILRVVKKLIIYLIIFMMLSMIISLLETYVNIGLYTSCIRKM